MGLTYPSNKICPQCKTGGYVWYLDNSEYVAKCTNCGHYFRKEDFPMCVLDGTPKPITNADHIRSMTDEELATWLTACLWGEARDVPFLLSCTVDKWLDWLRQPATE